MSEVPKYLPTASIEALRKRAELLHRLRSFFDERDFIEVQTPILSRDTVIDRHIDLLSLEMTWPDDDMPNRWYLQSSPEAAMKRLLSAGMKKIYQVGPVFRAGERGAHHNPEFTMAEWYRVGDDLEAGLRLLSDLLTALLDTAPCKRIQYAVAFYNKTGLDVREVEIEALANRAIDFGAATDINWSDDWDDWVNLLFSTVVQPSLGHDGPTLVSHFRLHRPRWLDCRKEIFVSPNASNFFIAALSWPTAITSYSIPRFCAEEMPKPMPIDYATASKPCPSRASSWTQWTPDFQPPPAVPWDSTEWLCWPAEPKP